MANLHIGDSVTFRDRVYFVRGMSPMGVETRRVQLEEVGTGALLEAGVDEVQRVEPPAVVDQERNTASA